MKRKYVNPEFNSIEIEPVELLAGSGAETRIISDGDVINEARDGLKGD